MFIFLDLVEYNTAINEQELSICQLRRRLGLGSIVRD